MAEGSSDNTIKVWPQIVWVCRGIWKRWKILFFIDSVGGIWSGLLLLDRTTLPNLLGVKILERVSPNWPFFLVLFIALVLLTITCGLVVRLDAPLSSRQLRRRYLRKVIDNTQKSTIKGIPAEPFLGLQSVYLADIFIPLQFYENRPNVDYPLPDRDLEHYRQELKRNNSSYDLQQVVLEARKSWWRPSKEFNSKRIGIAELWKLLTRSHAVAIEGQLGTGKSTLMERLALYMALRLSHRRDSNMPEQQALTPHLLPIILSLGEYGKALQQAEDLSLHDYMLQALEKMRLPGLSTFIQNKLESGSCLVILDGLDEVTNLTTREIVQNAIKSCIHDHPGEQATPDALGPQNRFLITSRVAGYNPTAFPDYPHVTIAELVDEQVQDFLPRWCRANLCQDRHISVQEGRRDADIEREVAQRVQVLQTALRQNQAIKELVQIPLLLTFLVLMQYNGILLPQQRYELYNIITRTLLETRNKSKQINPILSVIAERRLGPLAFEMQEKGHDLAHERDVMKTLIQVIKDEGGNDEAVQRETTDFLDRIRKRGGLFVQRSGDYFGFMLPAFQHYFAARHIINKIKVDESGWIRRLVTDASRLDIIWHEPFLLAVACQSSENEVIANKILEEFLKRTPRNPLAQFVDHLRLAANAVIEAKPGKLKPELEKQIAEQLLTAYERSQREQTFAQCQAIELVMQHWLLSLPEAGYCLPLLDIISQALSPSQDITHLCTILTLLPIILDPLDPLVVFETCRPLLDALMSHPDANITNLAQSALNRLDLCVQHST
jgi:hypothetical protein